MQQVQKELTTQTLHFQTTTHLYSQNNISHSQHLSEERPAVIFFNFLFLILSLLFCMHPVFN